MKSKLSRRLGLGLRAQIILALQQEITDIQKEVADAQRQIEYLKRTGYKKEGETLSRYIQRQEGKNEKIQKDVSGLQEQLDGFTAQVKDIKKERIELTDQINQEKEELRKEEARARGLDKQKEQIGLIQQVEVIVLNIPI